VEKVRIDWLDEPSEQWPDAAKRLVRLLAQWAIRAEQERESHPAAAVRHSGRDEPLS
jgi:hypothetical protein